MTKSNYSEKAAKHFRKSLSLIVETCLEKYTHKSIWNFRNNVGSLIDYSRVTSEIVQEARYLVKENPNEIDVIIKEMNSWYTGKDLDSKENYDPALVSIFTEEVTAIYVNVLGRTFSAVERLKEYEKSLHPIEEEKV